MELLNSVIPAEDYRRVRDWWVRAVGLQVRKEWPELGYCDLAVGNRIVVGVATASSMGFEAPSPRRNATVPQVLVDDVPGLLTRVADQGGRTVSGPTFYENGGYTYGLFEDCEGNQSG